VTVAIAPAFDVATATAPKPKSPAAGVITIVGRLV